MKLTLLHKGLLLVTVPLVFEVTIFGYLLNLQVQVEKEAQRINRNKEINDDVNMIVRDVVSMTDAVGDAPTVDRQLDLSSLAYCMTLIKEKEKDIAARAHHLNQLARESDDPKIQERVSACSRALALTKRDLYGLTRDIKLGGLENMPHVLHEYRNKIDYDIHLTLQSGLLQLGDESLRGTSDERSSEMREKMRLLLKCALALSVFVAIFIAVTFSKQLASRIARLSMNADRLAHGQELLAPAGGSDEVAELDRNFHHAADLIEGAKRMRNEVTAMITHDLKSPLQSILGVLEMLETGIFGNINEQGMQLVTTAQGASDHMASLIDSVLNLEKLRSGNLRLNAEPLEITALLNKCIDLVSGSARAKEVELVSSFQHSETDVVMGDELWLKEVFVNILSNAIKFTRLKTQVTIRTSTSGDMMQIDIEDQGPGIEEKERKLIFERFHRVQKTANLPGSGLGLTIAKEMINLHSGSIEVESQVGKGSTFAIRLPIRKS